MLIVPDWPGSSFLAVLENRMPNRSGQGDVGRGNRGETSTTTKYTTKGVGYIIECWPCKLIGKSYKYVCESSWSPVGREHKASIYQGGEYQKCQLPLTSLWSQGKGVVVKQQGATRVDRLTRQGR